MERSKPDIKQSSAQRGFTLIEISIVLVIIGLIVGGVLVGRDLIHAAQIRATIQQFEQFSTATNAFRLKYGCLPGDCANASMFGFDPISNGNGNQIIGECSRSGMSGCSFSDGFQFWAKESFQYWYHLSAANLIKESFSPYTDTLPFVYTPLGNGKTPVPKLSAVKSGVPQGNAGWWAMADFIYDDSLGEFSLPPNNLLLSTLAPIKSGASGAAGGFAAADAFAIDSKLDDGRPATGMTLAWSIVEGAGSARHYGLFIGPDTEAGTEHYCAISYPDGYMYNVQYTGSTPNGLCSLVIRLGS